MLWVIVFLLVILIAVTKEELSPLGDIQKSADYIRSAPEQWDRSRRETYWPQDPEPTKEEKQKNDELEQDRLRRWGESESGERALRIVCRRSVANLTYEVILTTEGCDLSAKWRKSEPFFEWIYTALADFEFFYRDGECKCAQPPELGTEVRCWFPRTGIAQLGRIFVENSEGRMLSFQIAEGRVISTAQSLTSGK
jgi:hypothetical protein